MQSTSSLVGVVNYSNNGGHRTTKSHTNQLVVSSQNQQQNVHGGTVRV